MTRVFRRAYGERPLHLAGHVAMFAVAAFAFFQIFRHGHLPELVAWYIGFALLQDLALIPLYSLADRAMRRVLRSRPRIANHIRVPAAISALLLIVYAPLIFGLGRKTYRFYSGHPAAGYLRDWVLVCAGLFVISAAAFGLRAWRRH